MANGEGSRYNMRFASRKAWTTVLAVGCTVVIAACSSSSSSSGAGAKTGSTSSVSSGGTITFALDEDVAGFNVLQAADDEFVLQEVLDNTWPMPLVVQPNLTTTVNPDYLTSAVETSSNPMTIVYDINPKAVWSDGVPISAQDFIYNWQSQSGNPKFKDVGGAAYEPASTAGFSQIQSVTSSNNGKTATVVFSKPFSDWKSLFWPLIPAHIAQKVGFNNGFQNFGPAVQVSGGPYEIQSYTKGENLVLVRNPKWWGTPGKLAKIVYSFILDDSQQPPAVQNGEANLVNPALASLSFFDAVKAIPNFTVKVDPGLEYQHLDFNESNPYLALDDVREAIINGTNRQEMVNRLVNPLGVNETPLENRLWMPTQPEYQNTSATYGAYDPAAAKALLAKAGSGMTMGSDGYYQPSFGPDKGKDLTLSISTTTGDETRAEIEQLFQADMKAIGLKIQIQNYPAATLFGTTLPKGEFDISEFAWVLSPFASANQSIYCSYTNAELCGNNWDHYANPQVDSLFNQATSGTNATADAALYNQIDALLWKDAVTLPLFEQPQLFGWSSKYGNIIPNTSSVGVPWNGNAWGVKAS
jgi:peptide/nickel transport system substrate-binding protein